MPSKLLALIPQANIPLASALLGGTLGEVQTITGERVRLAVPEGAVAYPGAVLRVRGEGLPMTADPSRRGDLFVRLMVDFPRALLLQPDERTTLRRLLSPAGEGSEGVAGADGLGDGALVERAIEPATEQDFGRVHTVTQPTVAAHQ